MKTPKKIKPFLLRLEEDLQKKAKIKSAKKRLSLNSYINEVIDNDLKEDKL